MNDAICIQIVIRPSSLQNFLDYGLDIAHTGTAALVVAALAE